MTGQRYDDDDAAFDAFLQGRGPLAQGLTQLHQPQPSTALDAAILARVAADLAPGAGADTAGEHAAPAAANSMNSAPTTVAAMAGATDAAHVPASGAAANDDSGPADFHPYRWRDRWRLPMALAAGVTAISIALPLWQAEVAQQQQAASMPMQDVQIPAVPAAPAMAPDGAMDAAAPDGATAAQGAGAAAAAASGPAIAASTPLAAPIAAPMAAASTAPAPASAQAAAAAEAAQRRALAKQRAADGDDAARRIAERERAETQRQPALTPAREPAPVAAAAPRAAAVPERAQAAASAPVPEPPSARGLMEPAAPPPAPAPALLARIEQLLREGKRDEAQAEWERLRAAYPDYPVPDPVRAAFDRKP